MRYETSLFLQKVISNEDISNRALGEKANHNSLGKPGNKHVFYVKRERRGAYIFIKIGTFQLPHMTS